MNPTYSIITPLFNKAPYVARAIGSILSQTMSDYELIVVDDGSTDGSAEVVERLAEDDARLRAMGEEGRFRLIRQENAGAAAARNHGAREARGKYLCFLDADDWWGEGFLAGISELIASCPEACAYGSAYYYYKNAVPRRLSYALPEGFRKGYINYFRSYADSGQMPLWTGAVCIRREAFFACGGFCERLTLGEDFYLWLSLALSGKIAFIDEPLSYYNQDIPVAKRAVGKLHDPAKHMLFNLTEFEPLEAENADYKYLIDYLRVGGLFLYYLDDRYRPAARRELAKVDWSRQPKRARKIYKLPVWVLKAYWGVRVLGSRVKQWMINKGARS